MTDEQYDVVVVGAGWSGLMALHHLRSLGLRTILIEAAADVGGTWFWNRYPGLRCDVESIHYSYSFDEQLQQDWTWSERYATRDELLAYARHVTDRFDLRPDIRFQTRVTALTFDAGRSAWTVECDDSRTLTTRFTILATGALSSPKPIDIAGAGDFAGETYTTTAWPEGGVDVAGKRVAIIGTGSSGIQTATEVAKTAGELFVLQRTPSYSLPAHNRPLGQDEVDRVKASYPELRESAKHSLDGLALPMTGKNALEVSDEERRAQFQDVYDDGRAFRFLGVFNDILFDPEANATAATFVADRIRETVHDPETAEALVPKGYPFGTRRLCLDSGYYEIFNQDDVHLVDLLRHPLERITPTGFRTTEGATDVDVLIYATGYDAFTGTLAKIDIRGVDGVELRRVWEDGARAYLGLMVHGFPNMFLVTGPQSPSVLSNMVLSIEQHVEWITACVQHLTEIGAERIEADSEAEQQWIETAAAIAASTLHRDSTSWYSGKNVEGKPAVVLPYLGGVGGYKEISEGVARDGYTGFEILVPQGSRA
jgi:cyclohexanone monooxygenase